MKPIILFLFSLFLFSNCSSIEEIPTTHQKQSKAHSEVGNAFMQNRKIIYNARLRLIVKEPDTTYKQIVRISENFSGYVNSSDNNNISISVKSENLNDAIAQISTLGKVTEKEISSRDVTDEFKDYEITLDNSEKARLRYIQLLEKAQKVEEILAIEKELERLNSKIAILKGRINNLKTLTDFSKIDVRYKKKIRLGILGYLFLGIGKATKWLFVWD